MDPRVKTSSQDLERQFALELELVQTLQQANQAVEEIHAAAQAGKISADEEKKLAGARRRRGEAEAEGGPEQPAFAQVIGDLSQLIVAVDSADAAPTGQELRATKTMLTRAQALLKQWKAVKSK